MKRLIFSLLLVCAAIVVGHTQTPLKNVWLPESFWHLLRTQA